MRRNDQIYSRAYSYTRAGRPSASEIEAGLEGLRARVDLAGHRCLDSRFDACRGDRVDFRRFFGLDARANRFGEGLADGCPLSCGIASIMLASLVPFIGAYKIYEALVELESRRDEPIPSIQRGYK
jgi:hypothetical protein